MAKVIKFDNINEWDGEDGGKGLIRKLQDWRVIPIVKLCNNCDKPMSYRKDSRGCGFRWKCGKMNVATRKKCNFSASLVGGTFFEAFRSKPVVVVKFARLWVANISQKDISELMGLSRKAIGRYSRIMRDLIFDKMINRFEPIGGNGKIVEIDESKFGKRKYHKGHRVEGQWVFGGIERESGKCFMVPVDKRDRKTLIPIIQKWILPGTEIQSDMWKPYDILGSLPGYNYTHLTVNHSKNYKDPETGACTNRIEVSWRWSKRLYNASGRRKKFFGGYLAKYMYLKWCKSLGLDTFEELLRTAGTLWEADAPSEVASNATDVDYDSSDENDDDDLSQSEIDD
jgi:hypothetical protein